MTKTTKLLLVSIMATGFAAPYNVNAAQNDSVSCSVVVVGSEPYQANFVVQPGVEFFEDFGNGIRFKDFTATTQTANGNTTVRINYFADVSTFDSLEFGTTLTLPSGKGTVSANGTTGMSSSSSSASADYTLTCRRT